MPVENSVTVQSGSAIVTGYLTSFIAAEGDLFILGLNAIPIASADSTSQITLTWPWPGTNATDRTDFYIVKTGAFWHDNVNTLLKVNELIKKIDLGLPFMINDAGTFTDRVRDGDQPPGFTFLSTDFPAKLYVKIGPNPTDWSLGVAVQSQATEAAIEAAVQAEAARDIAIDSADAAAASATTASTQASTATTQAGIATTQAGIATTQAGTATSANTAAQAAKTAAQTSETNAASSASAAAGSASTASTQAANAATSATAAQTARTGAETARTGVETAQSAAATSASNAATSATNAANSASAAAASASSISASAALEKIAGGVVASAVAQIDLTLPATHRSFVLVLRRLLPVNNNVLPRMRISLDGTTFTTATGTHFWNIIYSGSATAPAKYAYTDDVSTAIDLSAWGSGNSVTKPSLIVGEIDPGGTGRQGSLVFSGGKEEQAGQIITENGFGYLFSSGRWAALRLFFSAGNIAANSEYELYGRK
jgi:hypothetical protein